jgi:hypothetical protein
MCRRTTCRTCGRTTWAGCGQHVDQVLAGVPASERCSGHDAERVDGGSRWLDRLLGRARS